MTPPQTDSSVVSLPPPVDAPPVVPGVVEGEPPRSLAAWCIPFRNLPALSGYYFAIFSLIPIAGLVLGPLALTMGLAGLTRAGRDPAARGFGHALFSVVVGVLVIVFNGSALITCTLLHLFGIINLKA